MLVATAVALLSMTLGSFVLFRRLDHERLQQAFAARIENVAAGLRENLQFHQAVVEDLASVLSLADDPTQTEFEQLLKRNSRDYRGIQALEWIPRVAADERDEFERAAAADGVKSFSIKKWDGHGKWVMSDEAWSDEFYPVYLLHPRDNNLAALGIDLGSHPVRRMALEQARDSGRPISTDRIDLAQREENEAGFLVFVPVYDTIEKPTRVSQRRSRLKGFALGVFSVSDMINSVLDHRDVEGLQLKVTDLSASRDADRVLYTNLSDPQQSIDSRLKRSVIEPVVQKRWQFDWSVDEGYVASQRSKTAYVILFSGMILSILPIGVIVFSWTRAERIDNLVNARTQQLVRAQDRLRLTQFATDNASDAVFWIRRDGTFAYVNEQASNYLGYSREELVQMSVSDINPDYPPEAWPYHWNETREKGLMTFETSHERKDGSKYKCLVAKQFLNFEGQEWIFASVQDITYKKAQDLARRRAQAALDTVPDAVIWVDRDGKIFYVNQEACRRLQYSEAELREMNVTDIDPNVTHQTFVEAVWPQLTVEKIYRAESQHRRRDGTMFPVEIVSYAIEFDGETFACSFSRDLTARQLAQIKTEELASQLQLAIEGGNVGLWDWNVAEDQVYFSPKWHEQLGEPANTFSTIAQWADRLHPDDADRVHRAVTDYIEGRQQTYKVEFRLRHRNGAYRWILSRGHTSRDADGKPLRFVGTHVDITDQKIASEALIKYSHELERANSELEQFAYVASHDLKQPLRGIANLAGWIEEDVEGLLSPKIRGHLEKLKDRVRRMEKLLDDLLAYSRIGRVEGSQEWFELRKIVDDATAVLGVPEGFTVAVIGDFPTVKTSRAPLEQVLRNLVSNSIKHHTSECGTVEIRCHEVDGLLHVEVHDDGPGIEAEYRERIFRMFQTLKPRDHVEGSGMGLAIVQKLVEFHGGKIELAESKLGGASFTFTWPVQLQTQTAAG